MECSKDKIPFLDVLVQMKTTDETNSFTVHKETDPFRYFPLWSLIYLPGFLSQALWKIWRPNFEFLFGKFWSLPANFFLKA